MENRKSACLAAAVAVALLLVALPAGAEITGVTLKTSRNVSFY